MTKLEEQSMSSIKKILVDLDPTKKEQPALDRGIYLAKRYNASITLFAAVYNRGLVNSMFFNLEQLEAAKLGYIESKKSWLKSYWEIANQAGINTDTDVVWAKPIYEAINFKAENENYDLIIKSTHHHPTINKIFFTPNDWQLLKTCKKPLILAKLKSEDKSKPDPKSKQNGYYSNIMAAIDPSHRNDHSLELDPLILRTAREVARTTDSKIHAVHCFDPIAYQLWTDIGIGMGAGMGPSDFTMGQENYDTYVNQLKEVNEESFIKAIDEVNFPKDHLHLEEGYPESLLPSLVRENDIDLLVMGTSYHSGLVGSTIEKILDDVDCDVMAVKL